MPAEQTAPIDLHLWSTPNGYKVSIALEEMGIPYNQHWVNIGKGEQFKPEFLAIAPNNRIPAIVDPEGPDGKPISVFESGAILLYLGDKFGKFYPADKRKRVAVHEWLMWQMGGVGPMFGQVNHFRNYAKEKIPYAIDRYVNEAHRLTGVLDKRLAAREFVADDYSIADMAIFPWIRGWENRGLDIAEFPNVKAWFDRINVRPAVQKGISLKAPTAYDLTKDADAQKILFGQR